MAAEQKGAMAEAVAKLRDARVEAAQFSEAHLDVEDSVYRKELAMWYRDLGNLVDGEKPKKPPGVNKRIKNVDILQQREAAYSEALKWYKEEHALWLAGKSDDKSNYDSKRNYKDERKTRKAVRQADEGALELARGLYCAGQDLQMTSSVETPDLLRDAICHFEKALDELNRCTKTFRNGDIQLIRANVMCDLGWTLRILTHAYLHLDILEDPSQERERYIASQDYVNRAVDIYQEIIESGVDVDDGRKGLSIAYYCLSRIYDVDYKMGFIRKALELEQARSNVDNERINYLLREIGHIALQTSKPELLNEAKACLEESLRIDNMLGGICEMCEDSFSNIYNLADCLDRMNLPGLRVTIHGLKNNTNYNGVMGTTDGVCTKISSYDYNLTLTLCVAVNVVVGGEVVQKKVKVENLIVNDY